MTCNRCPKEIARHNRSGLCTRCYKTVWQFRYRKGLPTKVSEGGRLWGSDRLSSGRSLEAV